MSLIDLISEYTQRETALRTAMQTPSNTDHRARLLRNCADLLDRIETYVPRTRGELQDQIYFFMRRAVENDGVPIADRDVNIALNLSQRAHLEGDDRTETRPSPDAVDVSEALLRYVTRSPERVSLIGRDYRYLATSEANAAYYGTRQVRLVGTHLKDLIGEDRFETRARGRLEACFAGTPQEYYHALVQDGEQRTMRCQMKPVEDASLGKMALIYMHDVTGVISSRATELVR